MSEMKAWINGSLVPESEASVPLLSHGFSRGSAIFEILGVHVGPRGPATFRMDEHLGRLSRSAKSLGMELAYSSEEIATGVKDAVQANDMGRGLIKIFAYWGEVAVTKLVLDSKLDVAVLAIPWSEELGLDNTEPISACLSKWRKLHAETVPVTAKACANYLNGYQARKDANDRGYAMGIMLSTDGFLAEGSTESVFIVKDGILKTPPVGRVLPSITRKSILQASKIYDILSEERTISAAEVFDADEMFTAGTGIKVWPVSRFEDRDLDAPGPVTKKVIAMVDEIFQFRDDRFIEWFQFMN